MIIIENSPQNLSLSRISEFTACDESIFRGFCSSAHLVFGSLLFLMFSGFISFFSNSHLYFQNLVSFLHPDFLLSLLFLSIFPSLNLPHYPFLSCNSISLTFCSHVYLLVSPPYHNHFVESALLKKIWPRGFCWFVNKCIPSIIICSIDISSFLYYFLHIIFPSLFGSSLR